MDAPVKKEIEYRGRWFLTDGSEESAVSGSYKFKPRKIDPIAATGAYSESISFCLNVSSRFNFTQKEK